MIKLGSSDMSKAYVGSTEVSKVYLGSELVYSSAPAPLPYDAQVIYLESTGTQYIDLGIYFDSTKVYRLYVGHFSNTSTGYRVFGARSQAGAFPKSSYLTYVETNKVCFYGSNTMTSVSGTFNSPSLSTTGMHTIEIGCYPTKRFIVDGSIYNTPSMENAVFQSEYTLALFTENTAGTYAPKSCRFGRLEIFDPTTGVYEHDYIPVRVGQTGYLYDTITGTLKGNSGTGDFVLGNDVGTLPYDAEVEYLQSSGSQFIDTGIVLNKNYEINTIIMNTGYAESVTLPTVIGSIDSVSGSNAYHIPIGYRKSDGAFYTQVGGRSSYKYSSATVTENTQTIKSYGNGSNQYIVVNGTSANAAISGNTSLLSLYMFARHTQSGVANFMVGRIYSLSIISNGTLVRDYIPVRVGQVGYMYDKVSKELYSNSGTGSFTLGNDITV